MKGSDPTSPLIVAISRRLLNSCCFTLYEVTYYLWYFVIIYLTFLSFSAFIPRIAAVSGLSQKGGCAHYVIGSPDSQEGGMIKVPGKLSVEHNALCMPRWRGFPTCFTVQSDRREQVSELPSHY
jgi:hypothetical protein